MRAGLLGVNMVIAVTLLSGCATEPIFDQWYAGYSSGTFNIAIRDGSDVDIPQFVTRYPILSDKTIAKAVLPPWHVPTAAEADELP